jgi:hypothetical protein
VADTVSARRLRAGPGNCHPDAKAALKMTHNEDSEHMRIALREFALACRVERDRVARARLAEADRRFESASAERAVAEHLAARFIAAAAR